MFFRFRIRSSSPHILETKVTQNRATQGFVRSVMFVIKKAEVCKAPVLQLGIPQAGRDGDLPIPVLTGTAATPTAFSSTQAIG